jgi:hypothetical protein
MNSRTLSVALCFVLLPFLAYCQEDNRPILKESPARLVRAIEEQVEQTMLTARVCVAHDITLKRVRVLSTVTCTNKLDLRKYGYTLEVVHSPNLGTTNWGVPCYRFQHNAALLSFAAAEFQSGDKALAKDLVKLLGEAEPDLFWSLPDKLLTIQQIEARMKADDAKALGSLLDDEVRTWKEILKDYR